ncbi:hypothetical protein D3P08_11980 [Paenibacillus nanensis]|uniref:Uncharacterized protein n=1 Tax=Paenibacillus nanensis TaxID=393251 RepID=A0A3A1UW32_9BACL|nr:hypothetical protein [Paenibacillus nanensis]RIX52727.1 hypothetical protein D3P08_11980 [Paenibacillus nanensis]
MNLTKIPNGDEKVTVELTVKELMALSGIQFHANHDVKVSARKKLNSVLAETWEQEGKQNASISYQFLS